MPIFNNVPGGTLPAALAWSATYIALLILMQIGLMCQVVVQRRAKRVAFGDGGDKRLARSIRAHGNFIENVPAALVALILLPLVGAASWLIHLVGGMMVVARLLHAHGLHSAKIPSFGRVFGVVLTWASLTSAAIGLLALAWFR